MDQFRYIEIQTWHRDLGTKPQKYHFKPQQ